MGFLSIGEIFGSPMDSDPLLRWIPYDRFIDNNVVALKTGQIGMCLELDGVEYETLSQANLELVANRFNNALRPLDQRFRVYVTLIKKAGEQVSRKSVYPNRIVEHAVATRANHLEQSGLYSIRIFITVLFEEEPVKVKHVKALDEASVQREIGRRFSRNVNALKDAVTSFVAKTGSMLGVTVLDKYSFFEFLGMLTNPDLAPSLKYDERLDYFLGNTEFQRQRDHHEWGDYQMKVLTLKEEPGSVFAHMLRQIMKVECSLIYSCEWRRESNLTMTKLLNGKRRSFSKQQYSARDKLAHSVVDETARRKTELMNHGLAEIQAEGNSFGHTSITVVLFDQNQDRLRNGLLYVRSVFADKDAVVIEERKNRLRAFFSVLPGNYRLNIRYRYMLNRHFADLVPLYRPRLGEEINTHLEDEYLTVLQSSDGTPYYLNLHVGTNAASLISGATGAGKSVFLNRCIEDSQKYEGMRTFIVDIGGSYRLMTKKHGGTYITVGLKDKNFRINPFSRPYSPENVNAIKQLVICFLDNEGYRKNEGGTSSVERQLIDEAINEVYGLREGRRRLGKLSLPKEMIQALYLWINGGMYSHFFDNEQDDLAANRWTTWDYTQLQENPELLMPLMFYQFNWISGVVRDPALARHPKAFWCDEGWRFGKTIIADLVREAAKTWRKHLGWVVFATQDEIDLRASGLLEVMNGACHTKIFLPNPGADASVYGETFKLSERGMELLGEMTLGEQLITQVGRDPVRTRLKETPAWLDAYSKQQQMESEMELVKA